MSIALACIVLGGMAIEYGLLILLGRVNTTDQVVIPPPTAFDPLPAEISTIEN